MRLFPFQIETADQIAERCKVLLEDADRPFVTREWPVPFYQALSALTGSGKTPILTDCVAQIRAALPIEPIVLWISKAKAVVDQTFKNFDAGGKYADLIDGFIVGYLSELKPDLIRDDSIPYIALATVGTFNQKDKADGTLRVHKAGKDRATEPLWKVLRNRETADGDQRPLIVVYDEGHNLSDQQTDLLVELEPNVILMASATMRTPERLGRLIERLRDHGWGDERLVTAVSSKKVVDAGLVKKQIILGGYQTTMELALDDLLADMKSLTKKSVKLHAGFAPKAIYVSRTNISQEDGTRDNPSRPFNQRKAPPILIWRYLVEQKGIDPRTIAVYCDLKFDRKDFPPPKDLVLFSGGDDDFIRFTDGDYRHIIFNLSLQEGWDDPGCCFAYIDKSMGSSLQVEQVVGRVLRQPCGKHFADSDLNSANFYIRVDDRGVFSNILSEVKKKIGAEIPEIKLQSYSSRRERQRMRLEPKKRLTVPQIHTDSEQSTPHLQAFVSQLHDYLHDDVNTVGKGTYVRAIQKIGSGVAAKQVTSTKPHANRVTARWILRRGIQALYPDVVVAIDWADKKFDAKVEITSPAANLLRAECEKAVDIYLQHSELVADFDNRYEVGPVFVNEAREAHFSHSLHRGYSDLNDPETEFARALDDTGLTWVRNPSNGGFSIPLLEKGKTRHFYPDFLVWKKDVVYAFEPKGGHLIAPAAATKLLDIRDKYGKHAVIVTLITKGTWSDPLTQPSKEGFTLWELKAGRIRPTHYDSLETLFSETLQVRVKTMVQRKQPPKKVLAKQT